MAKMTEEKILTLDNIEAMALCNKLDLPEGSRDEMVDTLLVHFGFKKGSAESPEE